MDSSRLGNLFFLLSTASVAAGCSVNIGGDDDAAGDTSTGGASDGTGTTGGTSSDNATAGSADGGTTSGDTTAGESESGEDTGSTSAADDAGTTGGTAELCEGQAAKYVECFPQYSRYEAEAIAGCMAELEAAEGDCLTALEEFYACIAASDCAEWESEEGACSAEELAVADACATEGGGTSQGS